MKYKLFTVADPSDSKIIGVADTVNVLPEINKQGQLCWRSRPGLGELGKNLSGVDGGGGGASCLYDGSVFARVPKPTPPFPPGFYYPPWDNIDNVTGTYMHEVIKEGGDFDISIRAYIRTIFTAGSLMTATMIYSIVDGNVGSNPSINFAAGPRSIIAIPTKPDGIYICTFNIDSDETDVTLWCEWVLGTEPLGIVTVQCFKMEVRDWRTAGESEGVLTSWEAYGS